MKVCHLNAKAYCPDTDKCRLCYAYGEPTYGYLLRTEGYDLMACLLWQLFNGEFGEVRDGDDIERWLGTPIPVKPMSEGAKKVEFPEDLRTIKLKEE